MSSKRRTRVEAGETVAFTGKDLDRWVEKCFTLGTARLVGLAMEREDRLVAQVLVSGEVSKNDKFCGSPFGEEIRWPVC